MTDNMLKFLQAVSKDDAMYAKFGSATQEEMIAMAAEMGIALTAADFEKKAELDEDELDAVAGGKECVCVLGGGGEGGGRWDSKVCACVLGGGGETGDGGCRCVCTVNGWGRRMRIKPE